MTVLGLFFAPLMSAIVFYKYYVNPTYEMWRWKTNPKYPTPEKVRDEIWQMTKSICSATIFPALTLYLSRLGYVQGYCGVNKTHGFTYDIASFFVIVLSVDFYEWFYHQLGHSSKQMWQFHRAHHVFFNPSPFSVIADEMVDMSARAFPLLLIPTIAPVNVDILFFTFVVFFYGYGTYLHWGYEHPSLSAHGTIINTSYHHYLHHAISGGSSPYHTGFFLQIWDRLAGSVYHKDCFCAVCEQKNGKRERKQFDKVVKPDYSVLLDPNFWTSSSALKYDDTVNDVKMNKETGSVNMKERHIRETSITSRM